jgi:hypothetical protein
VERKREGWSGGGTTRVLPEGEGEDKRIAGDEGWGPVKSEGRGRREEEKDLRAVSSSSSSSCGGAGCIG